MKKMKNTFTLLFILCLANLTFAQKNEYKKVEKNTMEGTKFGVEKNGIQIIPAEYDALNDYSDGKFCALKGKKVGAIDTLNQIVIPFKYTNVTDFIDGRTFVSLDYNYAMANDKGKVLTSFDFEEVLGYENGIATVVVNNKIGFVNKDGKTIVQPKLIEGFAKGNFIVGYTKSWKSLGYNYIQKDFFGNVLDKGDVGMSGKLPIIFDKTGNIIYKGRFSERVEITPNGKLALTDLYIGSQIREYNIINQNGEILQNFNGGASVTIKEEWFKVNEYNGSEYKAGIIDMENGKWLLPQNFNKISDYRYNDRKLAKVEFTNGGFFYINKKAECVEFEGQTCPE